MRIIEVLAEDITQQKLDMLDGDVAISISVAILPLVQQLEEVAAKNKIPGDEGMVKTILSFGIHLGAIACRRAMGELIIKRSLEHTNN